MEGRRRSPSSHSTQLVRSIFTKRKKKNEKKTRKTESAPVKPQLYRPLRSALECSQTQEHPESTSSHYLHPSSAQIQKRGRPSRTFLLLLICPHVECPAFRGQWHGCARRAAILCRRDIAPPTSAALASNQRPRTETHERGATEIQS